MNLPSEAELEEYCRIVQERVERTDPLTLLVNARKYERMIEALAEYERLKEDLERSLARRQFS